jgi:hypothetical protein
MKHNTNIKAIQPEKLDLVSLIELTKKQAEIQLEAAKTMSRLIDAYVAQVQEQRLKRTVGVDYSLLRSLPANSNN